MNKSNGNSNAAIVGKYCDLLKRRVNVYDQIIIKAVPKINNNNGSAKRTNTKK